jgi:hypothetical protein
VGRASSQTFLHVGDTADLCQRGEKQTLGIGKAAGFTFCQGAYRRGTSPRFSVSGTFGFADGTDSFCKFQFLCGKEFILCNRKLCELLL